MTPAAAGRQALAWIHPGVGVGGVLGHGCRGGARCGVASSAHPPPLVTPPLLSSPLTCLPARPAQVQDKQVVPVAAQLHGPQVDRR